MVSVQPTEVTPSTAFNGRVEAVDLVQLRARVTGFLEERLFDEGADVKAGDLLFVIEKKPYEAVVAQRQAELASAEARRRESSGRRACGTDRPAPPAGDGWCPRRSGRARRRPRR